MAQDGSYDEFWLSYLHAHSKRLTRLMHYSAVTISIIGFVAALWHSDWRFAAAGIVAGYLTAWAAHFTVQRNEPVKFASFRWAVWSLVSGLRMYVLGLTGQLALELKRVGIGPALVKSRRPHASARHGVE